MINVTPPTNFVSLPQPLPPQLSDQPFDLLLGIASAPVAEAELPPAAPPPAESITAEAIEPGATLLAFLGYNPVKTPQGEAIAKDVLRRADDDDDLVVTDTAVPPLAVSVPPFQPIIAVAPPVSPVAEQVSQRPVPDAPTRNDIGPNAISLRGAAATPAPVAQLVAAIAPQPLADMTKLDPEPLAAAERAAVATPIAPPVISTGSPASPLAPKRNDAKQPDTTQLAIAASFAPVAQGRSPQSATLGRDAPEERIADGELLGTSPTNAMSPAPTLSLANGPTTTVAIPQADPVQTIADRQLDLARDTRWIDELARDIVSASGRSDRLSFSLVPPQLGQLHVDLSRSDQGLSVHMRSDSEATTQIVGAAQPRLVEELKSQGIRVASTEVSTGGGQSQGQSQQQRDDSQLFEFARQRFEPSDDNESDRPGGRFA